MAAANSAETEKTLFWKSFKRTVVERLDLEAALVSISDGEGGDHIEEDMRGRARLLDKVLVIYREDHHKATTVDPTGNVLKLTKGAIDFLKKGQYAKYDLNFKKIGQIFQANNPNMEPTLDDGVNPSLQAMLACFGTPTM